MLNRRFMAFLISLSLALATLTGCAEKKVDYGNDSVSISKNVIKNVNAFNAESIFTDEFTVNTDSGEVKITISAKPSLPKCETMSVMEVEQISYTTKLKEKVLKSYFADSQIYYYDEKHLTKTELQNMIDFLNETDDLPEQINKNDLIKEYTGLLANAKDEWSSATEYDTCDTFVGQKGNTWYYLKFGYRGEDNDKTVDYIAALPIGRYVKKSNDNTYEWSKIFDDGYIHQYYGPELFKDYNTVNEIYSDEHIWLIPDDRNNEAGITMDEARSVVDKFVESIGLEPIPQTEERECYWEAYNTKEDNVYTDDDIRQCAWGYTFIYDFGMDGMVFSDSLDPTNYRTYWNKNIDEKFSFFMNESREITVNEYGVGTFHIDYPVSVVRKQEEVELLPVEKIFDIAIDELKNNANDYVVDHDIKYDSFNLGYIRVKNCSDTHKYSYIPAWSLELSREGEVIKYCPVFINAIDGTIIHSDQIF